MTPSPGVGVAGVLVLGVDSQIGLTIVRELGLHGARVVAVGSSRRAVGLYSRWAHVRAVSPQRDPARLALIRQLRAKYQLDFLMAVSEPDLLWLNRHRDNLSDIRLLIPSPDKLRVVLDKEDVYRIAGGLGIRTPHTVHVETLADVEALAHGIAYPVVLKWARPNDIMPRLSVAGIRMRKYEYCYTADSLIASLRRYEPLGLFPMVQSYCRGVGLGDTVLMHDGTPRLVFRHLRVREWPPEGGFSTVCESVRIAPGDETLAGSVRLLQAIGWEGPAMVEYRYDQKTGHAILMEINGRFWGSLPLPFHAGAHFAWGALATLGLGATTLPAGYRAGLRGVHMVPELKRLSRVLFARHKIADRSLQFDGWSEVLLLFSLLLSPRTRYFVFWLRDPLPALVDALCVVGSIVRRSLDVLRPGRAR